MKRTSLKRKTPLQSKTQLRNRTPLKQRGRNYKKRREDTFGEKAVWIRQQRCDVCLGEAHWSMWQCDPHHEPSRARGGKKKDLVPLCRRHHVVRHQIGPTRFNARYKIDLLERAAYWEHKWRERK